MFSLLSKAIDQIRGRTVEWTFVFTHEDVVTISGEQITGNVARRWWNGAFQYRSLTEAEHWDLASDQANRF